MKRTKTSAESATSSSSLSWPEGDLCIAAATCDGAAGAPGVIAAVRLCLFCLGLRSDLFHSLLRRNRYLFEPLTYKWQLE